jgi:L-2,4-diaminobutyrate decarboxylase
MVLAALGENGLANYINRQFELTRNAFEYVNNLPQFNCAVKPQNNILCFRIHGDDNLQLKIRDKLTAEGEFYITTTLFNNRRYLRLTIMNPDTHLHHIKQLIQRVSELSEEVKQV